MRSIFLFYAFTSKSNIQMIQMRMPIKQSTVINERINLHYKLNDKQLNTIHDNLRDKFTIVPNDDNDYILTLNLFKSISTSTSTSNLTQIYNSYLSIFVKDIYLGIYGEYIIEHLTPVKYQNINSTNKYYYFYSNETLIFLFLNYTDDKFTNINQNTSFIFDNTTDNIKYNEKQKSIKTYTSATNSLSNLKFINHTFYSASKITYSINNYQIDYY